MLRNRFLPNFPFSTGRTLLAFGLLATSGLLGQMWVTPVQPVTASGSISLDEPFTGATLASPSSWISIRGGTVNEWPCLTAASALTLTSTGTVQACVNQSGPSPVPVGEGALRLTRNRGPGIPASSSTSAGTLLYGSALSASEGIDISFSIRMDDGQVADGMSFFLKDGANATNLSGAAGGGLGYALNPSTTPSTGVPGGLFGVGFDKFGNFSSDLVASAGCSTRGIEPDFTPEADQKNQIVLRGPDTSTSNPQDGSSGYCYLGTATVTYSTTNFQRVRVVVPPYTPGSPTTVSVYLAPHTSPDLLPLTPTLSQPITISATTFKFGFSGAGGFWSNNHDLRGLLIRPAGPEFTSMATSASTGSGTGPTSGGTLLMITGTNIVAGATVTVGGQPCTGVTVSGGGTQLTCLTPAGSPGVVQVVVTNPNGGPGFGTFTYTNPAPTVSSVNPSIGDPAGGNTVTLAGTGFVAGATVILGGQSCTNVTVTSFTSLTCVAPAGTEGAVVDATVTNVGPVSGTGVGLYTYQTPPSTTVTTTSIPETTTTSAPTATSSTFQETPSSLVARQKAALTRGTELPKTGVMTQRLVLLSWFFLTAAMVLVVARRRTTSTSR